MPTTLNWHIIAVRLFFTVLGGAVIGLDRGERGRPAGLRTNILVCLAAALAMLQANLLMNSTGKASDSFVVLDLMRLPLGILSGMGFIGAGAILRKENLVLGVTTAATLWFVTVMGLCFGGGQIGIGLVALVLGFIVLRALRWVDHRMPQDRHGTVVIKMAGLDTNMDQIRSRITAAGFQIKSFSLSYQVPEKIQEVQIAVQWCSRATEATFPSSLLELLRSHGILKLEWKPI